MWIQNLMGLNALNKILGWFMHCLIEIGGLTIRLSKTLGRLKPPSPTCMRHPWSKQEDKCFIRTCEGWVRIVYVPFFFQKEGVEIVAQIVRIKRFSMAFELLSHQLVYIIFSCFESLKTEWVERDVKSASVIEREISNRNVQYCGRIKLLYITWT